MQVPQAPRAPCGCQKPPPPRHAVKAEESGAVQLEMLTAAAVLPEWSGAFCTEGVAQCIGPHVR